MKSRLASFLGVVALLTTSVVAGASPAQAMPYGCISGWTANYGYATCGGNGLFSVGVQCLKPGNVYYWNRSGWVKPSGGKKKVYCDTGHVAKNVNVWLTD